jgi:hypothetical protein
MHKINFSGHWIDGFLNPLVGVNSTMDNASTLADEIKDLLTDLPWHKDLLAGAPALVVMPGPSGMAAVLLAIWHGLYGHFPQTIWQVRDPVTGKFGLSEATQIDLQVLRNNSRLFR